MARRVRKESKVRNAMIKFENVSMSYGTNEVLHNINLNIDEGQLVVLIGPSGCGKTTTLQLINRLANPSTGRVLIGGEDIQTIDPVRLRRGIGYVIQEIGLFPHMTIGQNIEVVTALLKWPPEKRRQRAVELLELVDMPPEIYMNRYPSDLSGGQRQRIGLLRALAAQPPIILMDEPFGALDPITRDVLQDEIKKLQQKLKKTIVFVTHDMDEAIKIADVIILMKDGVIVQAASPEELLTHPADEFVEQFIGKHRLYNGAVDTVRDVMRPNPFMVTKNLGLAQCIAMMEQRKVSGVLVVDEDERPLGYIGVEGIVGQVKTGITIGDLGLRTLPTISEDAPAVDAFSLLIKEGLDILTVVNGDGRVVGVVTKTSMVSSLARVVWKEGECHEP